MNDLVLKEAKRLVAIREGEEVGEIPKVEAVLRAQHVLATVKLNAYAQKDILNRCERAE